MLIQILTLIVLQYNSRSYDREHVHIFMTLPKGITKKVNLVAVAEGYKRQK